MASKRDDKKDYAREQLVEYSKENPNVGYITSSVGNPIYEHSASLTIGKNGPIVLEDWQLLDTLSHFVRERVPERIVHAKGSSAKGKFICTADLTHLTKASVFTKGKTTNIRVRFSTVAGNLGSADTVRDPRGFAIKFYTDDGIWDLVGNNTPIFFIRDPILFPMFIHSQKRNPVTNVQDMNAFWDFISLRPETTHQVMFLMSDRGIPDGFRHMHGFGSHTFSLVNKDGKKTYCKFNYRTQQGIKNIPPEDAEIIAGKSPDYGQKDLYNAIKQGKCPRWKFYLQTMTEQQAEASPFNPFDVTKVWPHGDYPLQEVGEFVLDENPDNYFAEVEQLSFSPSSFVPGIGPSQDRMLLGRIFSYHDAHVHRLGANYTQLPVNRPPDVKIANYQRDGVNNIYSQGGAPNYYPNSFNGPHNNYSMRKYYPSIYASGDLIRYDTRDDDNFTQPRVFYRKVLKEDERQRLADNIVNGLKFATKEIQDRTMKMFSQVDDDFGTKIRTGLKGRGKNLNIAL